MHMKSFITGRKCGFLLFFLLAFTAVFYLTFVTDAGYLLGIPLTMNVAKSGVHMRAGDRALNEKAMTGNGHFYEQGRNAQINASSSYVVCLECQNVPASRRRAVVSNRKFFMYVPLARLLYFGQVYHNIFHPPRSASA